MLQGLLFGIATFFILVGFVTLVYFSALRLMRMGQKEPYFIVMPIHKGIKDSAGLLYAARLRATLLGEGNTATVIALDLGMNDTQRENCENLKRECAGILLCKPEDLANYIAERTATS